MSTNPYIEAITSLPRLAVQVEEAIAEARNQHSARDAIRTMREGESVVSDGREQIVAALTRSEESLKAMGLSRLPDGLRARSGHRGVDPESPEAALTMLRRAVEKAVAMSVEQANAVDERKRLVAAARSAEHEEQRRAAKEAERRERIAREKAEREARERAEQERRDQERRRLTEKLQAVQQGRTELAQRMWRPSKKRQLAELDDEIRELKRQLAEI